jgi:hypothetical protein
MPYFDSKTEMATVHEGMFRYKLVFFLVGNGRDFSKSSLQTS